MSQAQARALLTAGLPPLPAAVAEGLVAVTGRWPLLLRLVNKILADQARLEPTSPRPRRSCWTGCGRGAAGGRC